MVQIKTSEVITEIITSEADNVTALLSPDPEYQQAMGHRKKRACCYKCNHNHNIHRVAHFATENNVVYNKRISVLYYYVIRIWTILCRLKPYSSACISAHEIHQKRRDANHTIGSKALFHLNILNLDMLIGQRQASDRNQCVWLVGRATGTSVCDWLGERQEPVCVIGWERATGTSVCDWLGESDRPKVWKLGGRLRSYGWAGCHKARCLFKEQLLIALKVSTQPGLASRGHAPQSSHSEISMQASSADSSCQLIKLLEERKREGVKKGKE